jgi:hypothetical protein
MGRRNAHEVHVRIEQLQCAMKVHKKEKGRVSKGLKRGLMGIR